MTATIDVTADDAHGEDVPQPEAPSGYGLPARATIAIELLTAHPGNVPRLS
jgi:hypothetical protein